MAFWSSEKLRERLQPDLIIPGYQDKRIKHGAYELCLGNEVIITSETGVESQFWFKGYKPIIPSGQIAMLITHEQVCIPPDTIAFISIKATRKLGGLINISGFHVDPGFHKDRTV